MPWAKTADFDPVPKGAEDIEPRIAGVEACFRGEFTTEERQAEGMIAPRILGIAAKGYEPAGRTNSAVIIALAGCFAPLFDRCGCKRHRLA